MDRRTVSIAVAVVVIAVVAISGYVYLSGRAPLNDARPAGPDDAKRLSDMRTLKASLDGYFNANQSYPATPTNYQCFAIFNNVVNLSSALVPKYISSIPKDPHPKACEYNYLYVASKDGTSYALLVNLQDIDPGIYNNHWCLGASSGTVDLYTDKYLPCPS
jgi:hypothetical protein